MQALEGQGIFSAGEVLFAPASVDSVRKSLIAKNFSEVAPEVYPGEIGDSFTLEKYHFELLKSHVVRRNMDESDMKSAFAFFEGDSQVHIESLELCQEKGMSLCEELFSKAMLSRRKSETFPRITYGHALSLVEEETGLHALFIGKKELHLLSKLFMQPFFITECPDEYSFEEDESGFVLVFEGEEVASGSEHRCMNEYEARLLSELGYGWYLGGKKSSCGFGLSVDIAGIAARSPEKQKF
jgi:aspartyl/asparaginyl-tRNA synthetase